MLVSIGFISSSKSILAAEMIPQENWLAIINITLSIAVFSLLFFFVYWLVRQVIANERAHTKKQRWDIHETIDLNLGRVFADGGEPFLEKTNTLKTDLCNLKENEERPQ